MSDDQWKRLRGLRIDAEKLASLSDQERKVVTEQLAALERAVRENPLIAYVPHLKQVPFHKLPAPRSKLFIGGNRSGKTTATFVDSLIQCVPLSMVPEHLMPFRKHPDEPFYCRIIGPSMARWLEGIALQKIREWCPKGALKGGSFVHGWSKQQAMLYFKDGSWIQFMSNDQDLDAFAGTALHRVVYDEPPRQDIWGECRMRLIDYGGDEIFGLTPTEGMSNWLYDEYYEPWEQLQDANLSEAEIESKLATRVVQVDMDDNPHLSDEDKEWALAGLDKNQREARKTGRFVSFQGLIYPEFRKDEHVIPDIDEIPRNVECFEGLDPGLRVMAAVVFCYLTPEDELVIYDELALKDLTVASVAQAIKAKREFWKVTPRWTIIDPASKNRSPQTGRSDQQEYTDHGIRTMPGQNDVSAGINRVKERLEEPGRLQICSSCTELLSEFPKYRWSKPRVKTEHDPPAKPVKKDDHLLDAIRYVCMARPMAPKEPAVRPRESFKDRLLRQHLSRVKRPPRPDSGFGPGQWA